MPTPIEHMAAAAESGSRPPEREPGAREPQCGRPSGQTGRPPRRNGQEERVKEERLGQFVLCWPDHQRHSEFPREATDPVSDLRLAGSERALFQRQGGQHQFGRMEG